MSLQHITAIDGHRPSGNELGGVALGELKSLPAVPWPRQLLRAPLLHASSPYLQECWHTTGDVAQGHTEGIHWRRNAHLLHGVIELHESDARPVEGSSPLRETSRQAYDRLFRLLQAQGIPHLWRVWNYVARINDESHGLERYRQFNLGRHDAFLHAQRETGGQVPAACAIGVADGPLSIAFLAGTRPLVPLENPRQVSAWQYPSQYGPRAPTFSRAALAYPPGQEALFISGTASIVGHETVHPDDVVAQSRETVRNIECLLQAANRVASSAQPFTLAGLSHRAYVRHARDAEAVRHTLQPLLRDAPLVCVQADICRTDLLVEIECHAIHGLTPT